jgi:hypothetical protein
MFVDSTNAIASGTGTLTITPGVNDYVFYSPSITTPMPQDGQNIGINPWYPQTPVYPSPCPGCGACPVCGRKNAGPVIPNTPGYEIWC